MHIAELLQSRFVSEAPKRGSYRTDMVKEFVDSINEERKGSSFKRTSYVAVYQKIRHLSDRDMAYFLSVCKDAKRRNGSFSKYFYWAVKPQ